MKRPGLAKDAAKIGEALLKARGNVAAVARKFGVRRQTMWLFVEERPELKAITVDCREAMKDSAESSLFNAVDDGEAWAVCFFLKCQARDRGYIEKLDIDSTNRTAMAVTEEIVDAESGPQDDQTPPGTAPVPA